MLRFLTAGESHGAAEIAILEGIPAGLSLSKKDIDAELEKRRIDIGRGGRGVIEKDEVKILSGVRFGKTLGSPIALYVENRDFINWQDKMSIEDREDVDKEAIAKVTPRPGHADLAGVLKYGFSDIRNVLERASARETVMRVAVGAICKKFLAEFGIKIASHTLRIGSVELKRKDYTFTQVANVFKEDPLTRCIDPQVRKKMEEEVLKVRKAKDTLGGIVEVIAHNVPVGLGSYVHWDKRLDGRIAQALMSIPSVKAVEIGDGIKIAGWRGSKAQDPILIEKGKKLYRPTNHMGGIEGGVSNGADIVVRVYHKPLSTLYNPLPSVNLRTGEPDKALIERSDVCVVARAGVISESMLAFVLADAFLEKFGGDSMNEVKNNFKSFTNLLRFKVIPKI